MLVKFTFPAVLDLVLIFFALIRENYLAGSPLAKLAVHEEQSVMFVYDLFTYKPTNATSAIST
ncbi:hypothetical protein BMS3Bbin09_00905 [bacterium BMS3Bbin09]|nr:hypothetical protein BMS3Bbin09_00905 [bacterium BMS3Bbin09]